MEFLLTESVDWTVEKRTSKLHINELENRHFLDVLGRLSICFISFIIALNKDIFQWNILYKISGAETTRKLMYSPKSVVFSTEGFLYAVVAEPAV